MDAETDGAEVKDNTVQDDNEEKMSDETSETAMNGEAAAESNRNNEEPMETEEANVQQDADLKKEEKTEEDLDQGTEGEGNDPKEEVQDSQVKDKQEDGESKNATNKIKEEVSAVKADESAAKKTLNTSDTSTTLNVKSETDPDLPATKQEEEAAVGDNGVAVATELCTADSAAAVSSSAHAPDEPASVADASAAERAKPIANVGNAPSSASRDSCDPIKTDAVSDDDEIVIEMEVDGGVKNLEEPECRSCNLKFYSHDYLDDHLEHRDHGYAQKGMKPSGQFHCFLCWSGFPTTENLQDHCEAPNHSERCERKGVASFIVHPMDLEDEKCIELLRSENNGNPKRVWLTDFYELDSVGECDTGGIQMKKINLSDISEDKSPAGRNLGRFDLRRKLSDMRDKLSNKRRRSESPGMEPSLKIVLSNRDDEDSQGRRDILVENGSNVSFWRNRDETLLGDEFMRDDQPFVDVDDHGNQFTNCGGGRKIEDWTQFLLFSEVLEYFGTMRKALKEIEKRPEVAVEWLVRNAMKSDKLDRHRKFRFGDKKIFYMVRRIVRTHMAPEKVPAVYRKYVFTNLRESHEDSTNLDKGETEEISAPHDEEEATSSKIQSDSTSIGKASTSKTEDHSTSATGEDKANNSKIDSPSTNPEEETKSSEAVSSTNEDKVSKSAEVDTTSPNDKLTDPQVTEDQEMASTSDHDKSNTDQSAGLEPEAGDSPNSSNAAIKDDVAVSAQDDDQTTSSSKNATIEKNSTESVTDDEQISNGTSGQESSTELAS